MFLMFITVVAQNHYCKHNILNFYWRLPLILP